MNDTPRLADDLLDGLEAIAREIYGRDDMSTTRRVQYECARGLWPTFRRGRHVLARRSELHAAARSGAPPQAAAAPRRTRWAPMIDESADEPAGFIAR